MAAYGPVYGPYSGWTARRVVAGPGGSTTILWTNADGGANYWTVRADGSITYGPVYGPY